jgi:hypothetical protein
MKNGIIYILFFLILGGNAIAANITSEALIFRQNDKIIDLDTLKKLIEKRCKVAIKENLNDKEGITIFETANDRYTITRMPTPIPLNKIKNAAKHSLLFKDSKAIETKQKAHIIISVSSTSGNIIDNRLKLTELVRSVLLSCDALGVYWTSSSQIIQKDIYIAFTDSMSINELLPTPIWLSLAVRKDYKGKTNIHSIGLKDLGYPEYEVIDLKKQVKNVYLFICEFTNLMIITNKLKTLEDIITVEDITTGQYANDGLWLTYTKSKLTKDKWVMRLTMLETEINNKQNKNIRRYYNSIKLD